LFIVHHFERTLLLVFAHFLLACDLRKQNKKYEDQNDAHDKYNMMHDVAINDKLEY